MRASASSVIAAATLGSAIALGGCGARGATLAVAGAGVTEAPAPAPGTMPLYVDGDPRARHALLGFVTSNAATLEEALADLRRRAASLGGNGIVGLDVDFAPGGRVRVRGAAVRFS